jgi:hypothetical protein
MAGTESAEVRVPVRPDIRFNDGGNGASWVLRAGSFTGLDSADRQALSDWLDAADGVDTVMDLALRDWDIAGAQAILGVFEPGNNQASWLIVRHVSGWTLARRSDGLVSDVMDSLPELLALLDGQRLD